MNYPKRVYILRGNHESRMMTSHFTFREEVEQKYDEDTYDATIESFENLPIASLIVKLIVLIRLYRMVNTYVFMEVCHLN